MGHLCDIADESDDPHSIFLLFKSKVLNADNKIHESKKHPDNDSILGYIIKTEASNVDKPLIDSITNELINQNLIKIRKLGKVLIPFS